MTIQFSLEEINTVAKKILATPSLKKVITLEFLTSNIWPVEVKE